MQWRDFELEYSRAVFHCVLGMRILLFFLFITKRSVLNIERSAVGRNVWVWETKEAVLHENNLKYQCLWNVDLAMHASRNNLNNNVNHCWLLWLQTDLLDKTVLFSSIFLLHKLWKLVNTRLQLGATSFQEWNNNWSKFFDLGYIF